MTMSGLRRIVLIRHGETVGNSQRTPARERGPCALGGRASRRCGTPPRRCGRRSSTWWSRAPCGARGRPRRSSPAVRPSAWRTISARSTSAAGKVSRRARSRPPIRSRIATGRPGRPASSFRAASRARSSEPASRAGSNGLQASGAAAVLAVVHRGVIRALGEQLLGSPLADATPSLGEVVALARTPGGAWYCGRHGSNPEGLRPPAVSA